jgi:hypothetical protein
MITNVWPNSYVAVYAHKGGVDGPVAARVLADRAGKFRIDLSPGTYTLVQMAPAAQPKTVTVRPGEYVHVTLWESVP